MRSPFPGMDPYLEQSGVWRTLHHHLLMGIKAELQPLLRPRYWVATEERTYENLPEDVVIRGLPDASVVHVRDEPRGLKTGTATLPPSVEVSIPLPQVFRERYLVIQEPKTGEVITVIEVLSPSNKAPGPNREDYIRKRQTILCSLTNLVEIDLLRSHPRLPVVPSLPPYDYGVLVCRSSNAGHYRLHPFTVRDSLPVVSIPLRPGEEDVPLDLGRAFTYAYDLGSFDLIVDYREPPDPPLPPGDEAWCGALLRDAGLR